MLPGCQQSRSNCDYDVAKEIEPVRLAKRHLRLTAIAIPHPMMKANTRRFGHGDLVCADIDRRSLDALVANQVDSDVRGYLGVVAVLGGGARGEAVVAAADELPGR